MRIEIRIDVKAVLGDAGKIRHAWVLDRYTSGDNPKFMGADTTRALTLTLDDLQAILDLFEESGQNPSTWLKREERTCGSEVTT